MLSLTDGIAGDTADARRRFLAAALSGAITTAAFAITAVAGTTMLRRETHIRPALKPTVLSVRGQQIRRATAILCADLSG
jgi:hypothetical protein